MLPYALAIAVGLSSFVLFLIAFFFKEIHRQDDFLWSGLGLFYALVLWFCATSITGAVLLGQLAVVALLTAYFWQVIKLRQAIANPEKRDSLDSFSVVDFLKNLFNRSSAKVAPMKETEASDDKTIETKNDSPSSVAEETVTSETAEQTTEAKIISDTKAQTTTAENATNQTKDSIPEEAVQQDKTANVDTSQIQDNQEDSTPKSTPSLTTANLKEILEDAEEPEDSTKDISVATPSSTETPVPEVPATEDKTSSNSETLETREIAVETVTVVEEETNWDDEVEDIPASSIKVIKEVSPSSEEQSSSKTTDSATKDQETNDTEAKSQDNPESSD